MVGLREDLKKGVIKIDIDGNKKCVDLKQFITAQTKTLVEFGYTKLTEKEVEDQINCFAEGKQTTVIGEFINGNLDYQKVRDGIYCKYIGNKIKQDSTGKIISKLKPDCYIVFDGKIAYQERVTGELKLVGLEEFNKATDGGYRCIRNLTDNELFAMRDLQ